MGKNKDKTALQLATEKKQRERVAKYRGTRTPVNTAGPSQQPKPKTLQQSNPQQPQQPYFQQPQRPALTPLQTASKRMQAQRGQGNAAGASEPQSFREQSHAQQPPSRVSPAFSDLDYYQPTLGPPDSSQQWQQIYAQQSTTGGEGGYTPSQNSEGRRSPFKGFAQKAANYISPAPPGPDYGDQYY